VRGDEPPGSSRVLCVTLNPALDITYRGDSVTFGDVNRVDLESAHAGGKGVNVARLLTSWGRPALVCGFAGGIVGAEIRASLTEAGIVHRLVACTGSSRRTVTVIDGHGASTGFYEHGPTIAPAEWDAMRTAVEEELARCSLAVLSGSLPPGVPVSAYRQLTAFGRRLGVPVVVDAHGKPLLHALDACPSVVKPNEAELAEAADLPRPLPTHAAVAAARALIDRGAERVVATLGPRGLVGVRGDRVWLATTPPVDGNPAGAGDAVTAVLADS
jgi:tagatose 6-phosphate kinase